MTTIRCARRGQLGHELIGCFIASRDMKPGPELREGSRRGGAESEEPPREAVATTEGEYALRRDGSLSALCPWLFGAHSAVYADRQRTCTVRSQHWREGSLVRESSGKAP